MHSFAMITTRGCSTLSGHTHDRISGLSGRSLALPTFGQLLVGVGALIVFVVFDDDVIVVYVRETDEML